MMLALGADQIYARRGVVLKPHYRALGRFHGSEMWTYTLPRRVGADLAKELVNECRDLSAPEAQRLGLIDECLSVRGDKFREEVIVKALDMVRGKAFGQRLADKRARRQQDEAQRPVSAHRMDELAKCWGPIFNSGSDYHEARRRFVYRHASLSSATQSGHHQDFCLNHKVA
jgi:putative two-component system hydrogenase maturation factor HypX/HoxX